MYNIRFFYIFWVCSSFVYAKIVTDKEIVEKNFIQIKKNLKTLQNQYQPVGERGFNALAIKALSEGIILVNHQIEQTHFFPSFIVNDLLVMTHEMLEPSSKSEEPAAQKQKIKGNIQNYTTRSVQLKNMLVILAYVTIFNFLSAYKGNKKFLISTLAQELSWLMHFIKNSNFARLLFPSAELKNKNPKSLTIERIILEVYEQYFSRCPIHGLPDKKLLIEAAKRRLAAS